MLKKDDDTCGEKKECLLCTENEKHLQRAQLTREAYRADVVCNTNQNNPYLSMDMQKVLMLPLLPGCKTAIFTRRIFLINQTFALLGGTRKTNVKPHGYLWHEGIQGRNDEDVASAIIKFLNESVYRYSEHVTIWCDNCSGQNKNWMLFSSLVHLMCSQSPIQTLTLKFFEKGHTFMSDDSFHHQVENGIWEVKKLYDFQDFVRCVESKGTTVLMESKDFVSFRNEKVLQKTQAIQRSLKCLKSILRR